MRQASKQEDIISRFYCKLSEDFYGQKIDNWGRENVELNSQVIEDAFINCLRTC